MYVRHKYSHDIFCSVTNDNLTYHALFGMLLVVTATVAASSLLLPGTIMVFAQEADGGDAAATMTSGANETAANAWQQYDWSRVLGYPRGTVWLSI